MSDVFRLGGDLPVHRLAFGAMRVTGRGVWGPPEDEGEAIAVIRRAVELGADLIDTADAYGPEVSERLIAKALHPYPPGLVIATKGGLTRGGPGVWTPNGSPEHLRAALTASLDRLKLDRIDLYQLHRADPKVRFGDSVRALARMRDEGLIRHVGLCNVSVEQLREAQRICPIVSVQDRYSLAERHTEDVLEACERDGIAFIPWFPLAAGDLTRPGGPLDALAARHRATPSQLALAWLLHRSPVMLPIPGTSSLAHVEENMAAARIRLTERECDEIAEATRS